VIPSLGVFSTKLKNLFAKRRPDSEFDEEVREHLRLLTQRCVRAGLEGQLDETLSTERLITFLSTVFALLATILAALGLYGVMAFVVTRRTGEIGLRMALGAPKSSVLWSVVREMLILLGCGLILGLPGAYALDSFLLSCST